MGTEQSTFVFADLAGFTALTEAHGDPEAIDIASSFAADVRALLRDYGGEEVKTIGDEVMIRVADPVQAIRLGLRIVEKLAAHGSPPVRVGMHSGPATRRNGDWFGATVNLASRVSGAANAGEVLLTEETRRQAGELDEAFELEDRGTQHFKHVPEPIPVYRALGHGRAGHHLEIDPVCWMAVDPARAESVRKRRGIEYFFCSSQCRRLFDQEPRRYVATSRAARAARKGFLINLSIFLIVGGAHLISWAFGSGHVRPSMLILFGAWAIALAFHFRSVRSVL
jgi:adenylate cyclase